MKNKGDDPVVTKSILKSELDIRFEEFRKEITLDIAASGARTNLRMDEKFEEAEEKASQRHNQLMGMFDDLVGELKASREEREVSGLQISNHSDRIDKLENKVFGSVQN